MVAALGWGQAVSLRDLLARAGVTGVKTADETLAERPDGTASEQEFWRIYEAVEDVTQDQLNRATGPGSTWDGYRAWGVQAKVTLGLCQQQVRAFLGRQATRDTLIKDIDSALDAYLQMADLVIEGRLEGALEVLKVAADRWRAVQRIAPAHRLGLLSHPF